MEWKPVVRVWSHPVDRADQQDDLFRMQGMGMDVIATRNHRMLLARIQSGSPTGLQAETPVAYETVDQLLPPNLSYKVSKLSSETRFAHSGSRAMICSGFNRQPAVKVVIPGLEQVCDWWWRPGRAGRLPHVPRLLAG